MKILVTGGAGFIGSNLSEFLITKGHELIIIDDLSSGKEDNLLSILNNRNCKFIKEKVEQVDLNSLEGLDGVIHLAAQASVPLSVSDFKNSSTTNLLSSINILDFCSKNKLPLVYASSSAVYGDMEIGNDTEETVDLLSPYSVDKYVTELYAEVFYKIHTLSSIGLRFFNVFGPKQDPSNPYSGVISIFVDRLLKERKIIINGGNQVRDFVYIDDVVRCIYNSFLLCKKTPINNQINVLTGKETSINELVNVLAKLLKVVPSKDYIPMEKGDPLRSNGTTEKMIGLLEVNLDSFFSLSEGLNKTINYIREHDNY